MGGGSQWVHIIARSILVFGVLGAHRHKLGGQQHVVVALKKSDVEPNNSPTIRREELIPYESQDCVQSPLPTLPCMGPSPTTRYKARDLYSRPAPPAPRGAP